MVVAETPMTQLQSSVVSETPTTAGAVGRERLVFASPATTTWTPEPPSAKPVKLFAAFRRPAPPAIPLEDDDDEPPPTTTKSKSKSKPKHHPASVAVAAARAYLKRRTSL
jgi:hypothetical protein